VFVFKPRRHLVKMKLRVCAELLVGTAHVLVPESRPIGIDRFESRVPIREAHAGGAPFVTEHVFYNSKDGRRVPMFIIRRKDAPRDGNQPVMLYGYGGIDVTLSPSFSPAIQSWLDMAASTPSPTFAAVENKVRNGTKP
jgi:prolyl oligopeptidase PreP (S9A serine peptidase family)